MESINKKVLVISLILALLTSLLIYVYIKKATTSPEVVEYINVYVASATLPPRHKIAEQDLKLEKVTKQYLNQNAVLNKADIIGKYLKDSVIEGEQILRERLVDESSMLLTFKVPEGQRAISINVNEQVSVSNLIRPGDYVDILAAFDREDIEDQTGSTSFPRIAATIIQNSKILAMGQDLSLGSEKVTEPYKTVTLSVSPSDAERLLYAAEFASITLTLRNVDDSNIDKTDGAIHSDVVPLK